MIKVVMTMDTNDTSTFEKAFDSMDDNFNINDNVFWLLDYGLTDHAEVLHRTEFGDIHITAEVEGENE